MAKPAGLPTPIVLILAGLWIFWGFGYQTVLARYLIHVNGVVVSSFDVPSKGAPRYGTDYVIRSPDGHEVRYTAGATDASLERSLPVGTRIRKVRWELGYEVDGRWVVFPVAFYSIILAAAFIALGYGIYRWPAWRRSLMSSG
ncbi:MAG: hypothetical protein ACREC1_04720 [Methylovirgula sp.]